VTILIAGLILNGFAVLGLAYSGCNVVSAVFFMSLSLMLHGSVTTGPLSSIVDIAPNYAGITLGIISTVAIMTGFISPYIVGWLTFENQNIVAWQHIYEICAGMLLFCGVAYVLFNDTTIQPWNKVSEPIDAARELAPLYGNGVKQDKVGAKDDEVRRAEECEKRNVGEN
jgi:MFS family permease